MIRSLQPTDHTSLLDVQRRAYQIEAQLLETADFPPLRETIDDINIEAPTGFVYIIDDNITGAVTVDNLTITRLVVDPAYFRQGIAQSLLQHLFEHSHAKHVMTGARNLPALALYARFGFTEVQRVFRDEIELVFLTRM
ncbi:GNAT family N-acetyltransferase [Exiguobacterium acetylicum]|uniref:GNAT family N-acetyltransferase n=1 Tax=Exiguobacterium acetylicum TaxID=41170 RepID=UPI0027DEE10E|nr:GNAT family N-acetyltransferase [Exiguobacterium acetylicum]MDQ6467722.1 GNAT family N-acetyltransferase [Exiguobacterium acetylicum]